MNPAVVAPDGFDVVDRSAGSTLQPEQRHILGSIARMLQHAAANKHFHGEGYHVRALNQYISQTHNKFRSEASLDQTYYIILYRLFGKYEPTKLELLVSTRDSA